MATILQQNQAGNQENEKDKAVVASSGESAQVPQGQVANAGQPAAKTPSSSGRFTNIQNFINANKSGQIGQQVTQKVGAEKQKATEKLQQTKDAFGGQINQVAQGVSKSKEAVSKGIENLTAGGTYSAEAPITDQAIADIQSTVNAQYTGPQSFGNEQQLAGEAQNLTSIGNASQQAAGRAALLQRFFGRDRPTYSSGQTRLDNLLLGRQNQALSDIRQAGRGFNTDVSKAQADAQTNIEQQKQAIEAAKQYAIKKAAGLYASSEDELKTQAQQLGQQYVDRLNKIGQNVKLSGEIGWNDASKYLADNGSIGFNSKLNLSGDALVKSGLVQDDPLAKAFLNKSANAAQLSGVDSRQATALNRLGEILQNNSGYAQNAAETRLQDPSFDQAQLSNLYQQELSNAGNRATNKKTVQTGSDDRYRDTDAALVAQYESGNTIKSRGNYQDYLYAKSRIQTTALQNVLKRLGLK